MAFFFLSSNSVEAVDPSACQRASVGRVQDSITFGNPVSLWCTVCDNYYEKKIDTYFT